MVLERETWTIIIYKQTNDKFLFYLDFDNHHDFDFDFLLREIYVYARKKAKRRTKIKLVND